MNNYLSKTTLVLFFLLMHFYSNAQDLSIGITGGGIFSNQKIENEAIDLLNIDYDTKNRFSWQAGLLLDLEVESNVTVQPGLLFSNKGYRYEDEDDGFEIETKSKPLYLHIPVPVLLFHELDNIKIYGGAGPYVSFGIGGEIETDGEILNFGFDDEGDIDWGSDDSDNYKTTDVGIVLNAGVRKDNLQLGLAYDLGLRNIAPNADEDNIARNRSFSINIAYFFAIE